MSAAAVETVLQLVGNLAGELRGGGAGLPRPRLDANLERDLGFDSLERAELLRRLEDAFALQLPARTLVTAQTPRDLLRALGVADAATASADDVAAPSHVTPPVADKAQREVPVIDSAPSEERARVRVGDMLFAAYAWALLLTLGIGVLAAMIALPRLAWRRHFAQVMARAFVAGSGISVHASGADHFPSNGPMLVVANHASYLDAIVLTKVLPTRCNFIAKRELARHFVMRLLLGRIGTRFVERADAAASVRAAQEIAALTKCGESFVFFAEGTFTREPGLRAFRMGAFVTAASASTPVVPVAIRGTRSVLRDGQWFPRAGPIQIVVSTPILPAGSDWEAAVRLRDRARAAILAGCGEHDLAGNAK